MQQYSSPSVTLGKGFELPFDSAHLAGNADVIEVVLPYCEAKWLELFYLGMRNDITSYSLGEQQIEMKLEQLIKAELVRRGINVDEKKKDELAILQGGFASLTAELRRKEAGYNAQAVELQAAIVSLKNDMVEQEGRYTQEILVLEQERDDLETKIRTLQRESSDKIVKSSKHFDKRVRELNLRIERQEHRILQQEKVLRESEAAKQPLITAKARLNIQLGQLRDKVLQLEGRYERLVADQCETKVKSERDVNELKLKLSEAEKERDEALAQNRKLENKLDETDKEFKEFKCDAIAKIQGARMQEVVVDAKAQVEAFKLRVLRSAQTTQVLFAPGRYKKPERVWMDDALVQEQDARTPILHLARQVDSAVWTMITKLETIGRNHDESVSDVLHKALSMLIPVSAMLQPIFQSMGTMQDNLFTSQAVLETERQDYSSVREEISNLMQQVNYWYQQFTQSNEHVAYLQGRISELMAPKISCGGESETSYHLQS